jgi:predicted RNA binding protein YcfA (HicA-like mRNA interferase family)
MTKSDKRFARLLAIPADFTWAELVVTLLNAGFVQVQASGSRCVFISKQGKKILIHRPHPGNVVKRYALRLVVDSLKAYGIIPGG